MNNQHRSGKPFARAILMALGSGVVAFASGAVGTLLAHDQSAVRSSPAQVSQELPLYDLGIAYSP